MRFNLNEFARLITLKEGKAQSLSIAQVKEVIKLTLIELALLDPKVREKLMDRYADKL